MGLAYPAVITPAPEGGVVVTFPDFPDAITQGVNRGDAVTMAADCLAETIAARLAERRTIPEPSPARDGLTLIEVRPLQPSPQESES